MTNLRESSDEDLPPKRSRSLRDPAPHSIARNDGTDDDDDDSEEEEDDSEDAEPAAGAAVASVGVSSRGRIRRPNPRLS